MNAKDRAELQRIAEKTLKQTAALTKDEPADLDALANVPVQLLVGLGETTLPVEELLSLKKGAMITLNKSIGDTVDIYANNKLIGHGELTLDEDHFGVVVTDII